MFLTKDASSPFYKLVYFDQAGERKKISTKKTTRKDAESFMNGFQIPGVQIDEMVNAPTLLNPSGTGLKQVTLEQFKTEYLEFAFQTKSQHYISSIKLAFRFLIAETGNLALRQLDKRTVEKFILNTFCRTQRGAAMFYRTLKAALAKAEDWEYITENPFKKLKLPKLIESIPVFISLEELDKICSFEVKSDLQRIYRLAYYTGMRRAEILNMTWQNVDMYGKVIKIGNGNGFTTKSKKERIIPICKPVEEIIKTIVSTKAENAIYVFETNRGVKYHDESVSKSFKNCVRKARLNERIHFHSLRHSFASYLVQKGVSLYVLKDLMGHADITTTMVYSHLKKENLIEAVSVFD